MKTFIIIIFLTLTSVIGYSSNGKIEKNSDKLMYTSYYDNGMLKEIGQYSTTKKRIGEWTSFWDNGSVRVEASFKKGKKDGEWKYYTPDGKLMCIAFYKKNKIKQYVKIDNGTLLATEH